MVSQHSFNCPLQGALFDTPRPYFFLLSPPLLCIDMGAASSSQVSPDVPQPHGHHGPLSFAASLSPTLVNHPHNTERPSLNLRIPVASSNILNSAPINISTSYYSLR